jgi:hypothetical protein
MLLERDLAIAPRDSILGSIARRRLAAELEALPREEWRQLLADRQIAGEHVLALGAALGLRLSGADVAKLRAVAVGSLQNLTLTGPVAETCGEAGVATRAAAADWLVKRCCDGGRELLERATGSDPRLRGRPVQACDWRALITTRWRMLPVMRPIDIADFLVRSASERESGRQMAQVA